MPTPNPNRAAAVVTRLCTAPDPDRADDELAALHADITDALDGAVRTEFTDGTVMPTVTYRGPVADLAVALLPIVVRLRAARDGARSRINAARQLADTWRHSDDPAMRAAATDLDEALSHTPTQPPEPFTPGPELRFVEPRADGTTRVHLVDQGTIQAPRSRAVCRALLQHALDLQN